MTTAEILDKITPCNTEKPYIFISYSDRDRELVWQDVLTLQEYGYNIWLDQKNLDITKNSWKDDALNSISDIDCQLVVFYVSKNSLVSENCLKELRHTINDETTDIHFGPVKFIAIDAQNIGNIVEFSAQLHKDVLNSSEEKIYRQQKARTLSRFIKEFFNSNNERVRIHYKNEENRKSDYYTDIMASFPDNTKSCQSASEKQMNEKTSNTSQPDLKEIQYSDGIYKGEIVNGKRHGYGIYTWNNGDVYEGDWVDDKRHGHGKQSYHNGYTYIGEWKDDKRHGHGRCFIYAEDSYWDDVVDDFVDNFVEEYYDGEWRNDKFDGQGILSDRTGKIYNGKWKDGKYCENDTPNQLWH